MYKQVELKNIEIQRYKAAAEVAKVRALICGQSDIALKDEHHVWQEFYFREIMKTSAV